MKTALIVIIAFLVILLIIGNLFTYPLQARFIMQPVPLDRDHTYRFKEPFEEIFLKAPDGGEINALHFKTTQTPSKGVVLYFHGNAGNLVRWGEINTEFTSYGYDFFIMDYRGFGKSTGPVSQEILYNDAKLVYDHLLNQYTPDQIIIYGRSLGSAMASNLASKVSAKMLILETPFSSMKDLFYAYYPFLPPVFIFKYPFLNHRYVEKVNYPILIFQGTEDWVVPYKSAAKLKNHIKPGDQFITIEGGTHNDLNIFESYRDNLAKALGAPS